MCVRCTCAQITDGDNFVGIRASVGITTGYAFTGLVGGAARCEYTTHGPLVNLAARLMVASEHGPLVDTETREACLRSSSVIEFDVKSPITVKGRVEPVPVFVPFRVGRQRVRRKDTTFKNMAFTRDKRGDKDTRHSTSPRRPRAASAQRNQLGAVPPQNMIGREQECELLSGLFTQVTEEWHEVATSSSRPSLSGDALCALIEGDAGIGKSELCREVLHYGSGLGMRAYWTSGHITTVATPLRPFRSIMQGLFHEESKRFTKAQSSEDTGGQ